jgi:hypothetical protein
MRKLGYHDHEAKPYLVSRTWHWTKIILRLITKVLSSIIIAIEIPTAVKYKEQQADLPQAEQQSSMVGIAITVGPLLLMTTWDTLELLTLCVRRRRRGIHPVFHIAAELFFWPLMAFLTVLISLIAFRASGTKGVGYADLQMFEAFAFGTKVVAVLFALMTYVFEWPLSALRETEM